MVGRSTRSLWGKELVKGGVVAKVVDEMWTYLYKNARAFYKLAFSNKPFGQTSSIVLAKIATWVLSTHVAIRGGFTYLGS